MNCLTVFSPAKINLFLAITGKRADGFHELVSVVAPVSFGDELRICISDTKDNALNSPDAKKHGLVFSLECNDPTVPLDATNLILRAAEAFRAATGWPHASGSDDAGVRARVHFTLEKRIPMGAGLGGGSSNATATLLALNKLAGEPLSIARLAEIAATIGSDCALFLHGAPVVMRGRGEHVEPLAADAAQRLNGQRVLIFKPDISINTAWAYRQLAAGAPASYLPASQAEARLSAWIKNSAVGAAGLLFNNMEPPAFEKFVALPVLLEQVRARFGVAAGMSGSGSACFALLAPDQPAEKITAFVRSALGAEAFVAEAKIL